MFWRVKKKTPAFFFPPWEDFPFSSHCLLDFDPKSYPSSRNGCVSRLGKPPQKMHQEMVSFSHKPLGTSGFKIDFLTFRHSRVCKKKCRPRNLHSMDILQSSINCSYLVGTNVLELPSIDTFPRSFLLRFPYIVADMTFSIQKNNVFQSRFFCFVAQLICF